MRGLPFIPPRRAVVALTLLAACAALFVYAGERINQDSAWYMLCDIRWLQGEALYRDIIDYNLPSAYILYIPAALLVIAGLNSAAAITVFTGCFFFVSYFLSLPLLKRLDLKLPAFALLNAAIVFGGLIQVGSSFGQREHVFLLLMLPYLLATALRYAGVPVDKRYRLILGVVAGLACSIKPHFILVAVLAEGFAALQAWHARREKPRLDVAPIALIATLALAWVGFMVFFPVYFQQVVPLSAALYHGYDFPDLVNFYARWLAVLFALLLFMRPPYGEAQASSLHYTFVGAALAGAVIFTVQNKGWTYHIMPCIAYLWIVLALMLGSRGWIKALRVQKKTMQLVAALGAVVLILYFEREFSFYKTQYNDDNVAAAVRAHPGPFMLLMAEISPAHPLALDVQATNRWAMRWPCFCSLPGLLRSEMEEGKTSPHEARVRAMLLEDFQRNKPVYILAATPQCRQLFMPKGVVILDWLQKDPAFRKEWNAHYRREARVDCLDAYIRK